MDVTYMKRCLQLAQYGEGYTAPNPMVGAVIVCGGKIIGEGFHRKYGGPHAEPNALDSVQDKSLLKKSTMYVSLEPCSHYGKTPPCADLIISHHIPRVVVGSLDPNPVVAGRGIEKLRHAGIDAVAGCLQDECIKLNKRFFTFHEKKRPYVTLKWAQTSNGFIDRHRKTCQAAPLRISNELTTTFVHKLRAQNQALMIGTNTALLDNPSLSVRCWSGNNPVRVVLDRTGRIPADYHLLDGSVKTIIYTETPGTDKDNLEYICMQFNENLPAGILQSLYEHQIHSVLVEGGSQLLTSFICRQLWDEAVVEISPLNVDDGIRAPVMPLMPESCRRHQQHTLLRYVNK